jgi:hypothetical protein
MGEAPAEWVEFQVNCSPKSITPDPEPEPRIVPLNQPAPVEEFEDKEPVVYIDADKTEPVSIVFALRELEEFKELRRRGLSRGVKIEVWGEKDDNDAA